jgi:hypothetical protein
MEPTARVPSGDVVMAARSRGMLRRAARDAGRYPTLVRPAEAALVMASATEDEAAAAGTEEGGSVELEAAVEVAAMRWVEPEDRRGAAAKRRRRPRRRRRPGGGGG